MDSEQEFYNAERGADDEYKAGMQQTDSGDTKTDEKERCHAGKDGDCIWEDCPQLRDNEPVKSGRHCPIDTWEEDGLGYQ